MFKELSEDDTKDILEKIKQVLELIIEKLDLDLDLTQTQILGMYKVLQNFLKLGNFFNIDFLKENLITYKLNFDRVKPKKLKRKELIYTINENPEYYSFQILSQLKLNELKLKVSPNKIRISGKPKNLEYYIKQEIILKSLVSSEVLDLSQNNNIISFKLHKLNG
jgi:uncharacterized protein YktA (UPF0223 family)